MEMYNHTESVLNGSGLIPDIYNSTEQEGQLAYETLLEIIRHAKATDIYGVNVSTNFAIIFAFASIGLITNIFNILVFSNPKMSNPMNFLLLSLSIADIIFIIIQFAQLIHYQSGMQLYPFYGWVWFYFIVIYLEHGLLHTCNWLVAVIGVWRFIGITWPLRSKELCSKHRTKVTVLSISICCFVVAAMVFLQFACEKVHYLEYVFYDVSNSELTVANDYFFLKVTAVVRLLEFSLPMLLMAVVTCALLRNLHLVRRNRQVELNIQTPASRNNQITIMLSILVGLFLLSNVPICLQLLINLIDKDLYESYKEKADFINIFCIASNCCSFFIYYGLSNEFRQSFRNILVEPVVTNFKKLVPRSCTSIRPRKSNNSVDSSKQRTTTSSMSYTSQGPH